VKEPRASPRRYAPARWLLISIDDRTGYNPRRW